MRRAFEPVKLIVRREGGRITVTGCNDTAGDVRFTAAAGWFPLDGTEPRTHEIAVELPAHSRSVVFETALAGGDTDGEVWAVKPDDGAVKPAVLRLKPFRELRMPEPVFDCSFIPEAGECPAWRITARTYCHGVHFEPERGAPEDAYFDLLPGETRIIRVEGLSGDDLRNTTVRAVGRG